MNIRPKEIDQHRAQRSPPPGGEGELNSDLGRDAALRRPCSTSVFIRVHRWLKWNPSEPCCNLRNPIERPPGGHRRPFTDSMSGDRALPLRLRAFVLKDLRPKKLLTTFPCYINLSASVDITVSCRVVEGLAQRHHGNRLSLGLNAGANSSSSAIGSGKMSSAKRFVAPSRMSRGVLFCP